MEQKKDLGLPISIVIAGVLIAASIYATGGIKIVNGPSTGEDNTQKEPERQIVIKPASSSDKIVGKVDAPVTIITYTDFECPFCKRFHETMGKIMDEYRASGKVSWVYRYFPLDNLHAKARKEAEASECAYQVGGNVKFWEYVNKIFAYTKSNDGLDLDLIPQIASEIGLDKASFEACIASGKAKNIVQSQMEDGIAAGARGTPYSVILTKDGKKLPIDGALPFEAIKSGIDIALDVK